MVYVKDAPALWMAAMTARLHAMLDQLLSVGWVLFQDMALVKPPRRAWKNPGTRTRCIAA